MNTFLKIAMAAAVAGAFALPMASQAAWDHHDGRGEAAAVGFGAGAVVGATAANSAYGSNEYGSEEGYDSYAYDPAPTSGASGYALGYRGAWANSSNRNELQCMMSPGSQNYVPCDNSH